MGRRHKNIDYNIIDSILWMQNERAVSPETILINGKEPTSMEMQKKLSSWLTSGWITSEWKEMSGWEEWKENELKKQKPITNNLLLLQDKNH